MRKQLQTLSESLSGDNQQSVLDAIDYIDKLEKALELYNRERERFRHTYPEITGQFFLSGGHGDVDDNRLPEYVRICPAYGCAWEQLYVKTENTISYEGS